MLELNCFKFIDELSSKAPVPGGGGAAAFVGSILKGIPAADRMKEEIIRSLCIQEGLGNTEG